MPAPMIKTLVDVISSDPVAHPTQIHQLALQNTCLLPKIWNRHGHDAHDF